MAPQVTQKIRRKKTRSRRIEKLKDRIGRGRYRIDNRDLALALLFGK